MNTYISILRGINVGGQKKIQMNDLKTLYENIGFTNVITYIQSGNVIFKASGNDAEPYLPGKIEQVIENKFGFHVPVIMRTVEEMQALISLNPFIKDRNTDLQKLHVTFLSDKPEKQNLEKIEMPDYSPDKYIISNREIYLYCPNGYGTTKFSNTFFESKLKVTATTRNWNTVVTLADLGQKV